MRELPPGRRRAVGLPWVMMGLLLVSVFLGILWGMGDDSSARLHRRVLATQARLLARSALAHGLHKVEKTVIYFDEALRRGGPTSMDVGEEDPAYLADLKGTISLAGESRGSWRVLSMGVQVQETARGARAFRVTMVAEGAVEMAGERWRERVDGEFRLFAREEGR